MANTKDSNAVTNELAKVSAAKKSASKGKSTTTRVEALESTVAKTWQGALDNILAGVAKSAHKVVSGGVQHILHTLQQAASNWFAVGTELNVIGGAVNEKQFSRLINEVFSRFGLSKATAYRWMTNAEVLSKSIPYEPARDAILTVFNGVGIVSRTKGVVTLTGAVMAGLKRHPAPNTGEYADCMDWAREVQLIAEKAEGQNKTSMEEFSKSVRARFSQLLKKRYDLAVEVIVYAFRELEATSEPLAAACLEAIEDSSIAPAEAGKRALAGLKQAQQARTSAAA